MKEAGPDGEGRGCGDVGVVCLYGGGALSEAVAEGLRAEPGKG